MKIVLKIGGTLLEDAASRSRMTESVAAYLDKGHELLVVHGGGKQLTTYLSRSGVQSEFLQGLRITTAEALDGVIKVFAGTVNKNLVAALVARGIPAVGISGVDGQALAAEKLQGENGEDFGYVGRITGANPHVWQSLIAARLLPVMACLAVGSDGQIYNVNADQAATACAAGWPADTLIFLTDVDGVRGTDGRRIAALGADQIPELLRSGAVTGGMFAKLRAVEEAAAAGVPRIVIRNGRSGSGGANHEADAGTVIHSAAVAAPGAL